MYLQFANRAAVLFLLATLAGCQTMMVSEQPTTTSNPDKVLVQVRPSGRKARNVEVDLKPNMRLQDVVAASNANFRNKIAYIVRTSPSSGQQHKLEAKFDSNRRVSLSTDYAVHPGDRVVIAQDTATSFDRVMKALMGRS